MAQASAIRAMMEELTPAIEPLSLDEAFVDLAQARQPVELTDTGLRRLVADLKTQVAEATGLSSLAGPARARVDDRAGWIRANIASFQRLLKPVTARLEEKVGGGFAAPVARRVAGAEVGAAFGTTLTWMALVLMAPSLSVTVRVTV